MSQGSNRRDFLKTSAVIGAGYFAAAGVTAQETNSPNGKIAFASIGVGGKGEIAAI
jgi:TPP-dependent pyruvate/acetoin dehydrogenase alpha subunit